MSHLTLVDALSRTTAMAEGKKPKKWISKAIKPSHEGVFSAKAKAAGETTREYAAEHAGDSGKLGKEARLANTLMGMHHGKKKSKMYSHPSSGKM
jgi:hypothetical protein